LPRVIPQPSGFAARRAGSTPDATVGSEPTAPWVGGGTIPLVAAIAVVVAVDGDSVTELMAMALFPRGVYTTRHRMC
jgi:hypothetical protein